MIRDEPPPHSLHKTMQGYRFEWWGGEYIEISRDGETFDVINVTDINGNRPAFHLLNFLSEIDDWRKSANEAGSGMRGWKFALDELWAEHNR